MSRNIACKRSQGLDAALHDAENQEPTVSTLKLPPIVISWHHLIQRTLTIVYHGRTTLLMRRSFEIRQCDIIVRVVGFRREPDLIYQYFGKVFESDRHDRKRPSAV